MNSTAILLGLVFSSIGFGYFLYGRKQSITSIRYTGLVLIVMPYLVHNSTAIFITGVMLLLAPRVIDRLLS